MRHYDAACISINNILYFNVHGSVHRNNILLYIQQDATLHSLFYLETVLYVSGGTTTHHQKRKQPYLQHLVFVTPLLLPAAIVEELERGGVDLVEALRYKAEGRRFDSRLCHWIFPLT